MQAPPSADRALRALKNGVAAAVGECVGGLMLASPPLDRSASAFLRRYGDLPLLRSVSVRTLTAMRRRTSGGNAFRVVPLADGASMRVDLHDISGALYLQPGMPEPVTTKYILENLAPGSTFVDVGANVGYYALVAGAFLRAKGGGGRVYAFEPNPAVYAMFVESVRLSALDGIIETYPLAVGDGDLPAVELYLACGENSGLSTLAPYAAHLESGELSKDRRVTVKCTSLDSFVSEHGVGRIDWLKIDVETAEMMVLGGMKGLLEKNPPTRIICETWLEGDVSAELRSKGYEATLLERLSNEAWGNVLYTRAVQRG
jgi:FkbM family methyltransferase